MNIDDDLEAVKKNGWALQYVKEQTLEICLAAVNRDYWALYHVKDLHLIADKIDHETINKGLASANIDVAKTFKKIVKIREANAIARHINDETNGDESSFSQKRAKVKL